MSERREKRSAQVTKRKATAAVAKKAKADAAAAAAAPSAAPAPATGAGFIAGGTRDIETIVAPPGTAHTEPADSLIATLFGGGEQSLSLVDSGGSALWVANSLAPGLEELTITTPQAPGEPMRGTLGRGGGSRHERYSQNFDNALAATCHSRDRARATLGPRSPSRTHRSLQHAPVRGQQRR